MLRSTGNSSDAGPRPTRKHLQNLKMENAIESGGGWLVCQCCSYSFLAQGGLLQFPHFLGVTSALRRAGWNGKVSMWLLSGDVSRDRYRIRNADASFPAGVVAYHDVHGMTGQPDGFDRRPPSTRRRIGGKPERRRALAAGNAIFQKSEARRPGGNGKAK